LNLSQTETGQGGTGQSGADQGETSQGGAGQGKPSRGRRGQGGNSQGGAAAALGSAAVITAVALIVVYIAMLGILMALRADKEWDRLVYLLSGFEAIVFAGAGALFGTTIQRANVSAARDDAADAKETARAERDRADQAEKDASGGRTLAAAIQAKAEARADGSGRVRGSRPEAGQEAAWAGPTGLDADLQELSALARKVMPDI
jgi:hypothetical protein